MTTDSIAPPGSSTTSCVCCSFCSKDEKAVSKLVAGPGVYICDCCVDLCGQIISGESAGGVIPWNERSDEEMLVSLARIHAVISQVDAALHDYVGTLRSRGVTWTRIGESLGVSKQAAWERFSGEE